ncbi:MAG: rhodanese-like domain-containing protein [Clostridia bacterium]|nr:rhodanese-like domain-containing protein [Clostridia bacterium]
MIVKKLSGVLAVLLLLSACQAAPTAESKAPEATTALEPGAMGEYHKITAEEANKMMEEQEVTIVDVRTKAEYEEGHVPGAVLIPNESIGSEPPEALTDKEANLLVYCRSGRRSKEAADKLLALGYQNVYDFGGIIDWPYDVVKD